MASAPGPEAGTEPLADEAADGEQS